MTAPERPSARLYRQEEGRWRSVIRVFAVVAATLGLIVVGNEILENIVSCNAGACVRIHLSTMLWGLSLMSLGLLIIQRGDVSTSIREFTASGQIVRGWFGRRSYDQVEGVRPIVTDHDEGVG